MINSPFFKQSNNGPINAFVLENVWDQTHYWILKKDTFFFRISSGFNGCPPLSSDQLLSGQTRKTKICLFLECNRFTLITDIVVFFCIKILYFQFMHVFILNMRSQKVFRLKRPNYV